MIIAISKDNPWWEKTRAFAKDCPWQPGRRLAERMSKNDFLDWEKVFIAVHGENVVGFCVLEENGNIPAKFSCSPFINLVYVGEEFRGERLSKSLIDAALDYAQRLGYKKVYLKSEHPDTRIVVDIEVEEDSKHAEELERRNRRRDFYLRNGFDASPVDYVWQGEHYRLLSAGGTVTEKEFRDFWKEILKDIPGAKYP